MNRRHGDRMLEGGKCRLEIKSFKMGSQKQIRRRLFWRHVKEKKCWSGY
jgi:hypothetical protein